MKLTNSLNVKQLIETEWFEQFDSMQQKHIEEGLLQGLQVELYADPRFTAAQMQEIRRAMIQGIDVSSILNVRIGARKMKILANEMQCRHFADIITEDYMSNDKAIYSINEADEKIRYI